MSTSVRVIKSIEVTDSILTATSVLDGDYPAWDAVTTYGLDSRAVLNKKVYQSVQATNVGNNPETELLWWVFVSYVNKWKLFDQSSTTTTSLGVSEFYELTPGQAVNSVSLIGIANLTSVRIRLIDPSFGVVYDKSTYLEPVIKSSTWYAWFFIPRSGLTQLVVSDLPSYPNAKLRIDISSSGGGSIGTLIFGVETSFGLGVNYGARLGIQDYSRKERNQWGDTTLVKRAYARKLNITLDVDNSNIDSVYALLSDLRATPCLWITSNTYGSMSIFGFYSTFEITIAYPTRSEISLEIEGLT